MHRSMLRSAPLLLIATLMFLAFGTRAFALWAAPVEDRAITLPYAAIYQGKTHHGVDIAARAGAEVRTPVGGIVVFAGQVPADGGGSCWAVTVETSDGLRVSLLPLASAQVSADGRVGAGDAVGALAATGDDSSGEAHLHLSLRKGEEYLDPTAFLPASAVQADQPPAVPEAPSPAQPPAAGGTAAAASTSVAAPTQAPAPVAAVAASAPMAIETPLAPPVVTTREIAEIRTAESSAVSADEVTGLGQTPSLSLSLPAVKTTVSASLLLAMAVTGVAISYQRRVMCHAR